jgi:predicted RNA-binding protein with PIN domain
MHIVIDGYNLLKRMLAVSYISEHTQYAFVSLLVRYAKDKKHDITLVFDGGDTPRAQHKQNGPVTIVKAGYAGDADGYIRQYLADKKGVLLVTSDRALARSVEGPSITIIDVEVFYHYLEEYQEEDALHSSNSGATGTIRRLEDSNYSPELEELMEGTVIPTHLKDDTGYGQTKKRVSRKLSKHERVLSERLKKL